jgi:hypothetical protein
MPFIDAEEEPRFIPVEDENPRFIPVEEDEENPTGEDLASRKSRLQTERYQINREALGSDVLLGITSGVEKDAQRISLPRIMGTLAAVGQVIKGLAVDTMKGNVLPVPGRTLPNLENTGRAIHNEFGFWSEKENIPLDTEGLHPLQRGIAEGAAAAPVLGVGALIQAATKAPAPLVYGPLMAADANAQGAGVLDTAKAGMVGAVIPKVGELSSRFAGESMAKIFMDSQKVPIGNTAQKVVESTASQTGVQAFIEGTRAGEYLAAEPGKRGEMFQESVGSNLAFLPMEAPRFRRGVASETMQNIEDFVGTPQVDLSPDAVDRAAQENLNPKNEQPNWSGESNIRRIAEGQVPTGNSGTAGKAAGQSEQESRPSLHGEAPYILRDKKAIGLNPDARVDSTQLRNTLKNKITPGEYLALEEAGLSEFLQEKRTPAEVAKWVEENGPQLEVSVLAPVDNSNKNHPRNIARRLQHEMESEGWGIDMIDGKLVVETPDGRYIVPKDREPEGAHEVRLADLPKEQREKFEAYRDAQLKAVESPEMTSEAWTGSEEYNIDPLKPQEMVEKGGVDILVNAKIKGKGKVTRAENGKWVVQYEAGSFVRDAAGRLKEYDTYEEAARNRPLTSKFRSTHFERFAKNLVVHTRGHFEIRDGKKVFVINELQSDWAQKRRAAEDDMKAELDELELSAVEENGRWLYKNKKNGYKYGEYSDFKSKAELRDSYKKKLEDMQDVPDHPFLSQFDRIGMKAAIDYARKNGAEAIVVADAETAMLTEFHHTSAKKPAVAQEDAIGDVELSDIEKYFKIGRIIPTWGGYYDKVLEFKKQDNGTWKVHVQSVDKEGTPVNRSRWHATAPARDDIVYANLREKFPDEERYKIANDDFHNPNTFFVRDMYGRPTMKQEGGMRLNYDKVLPKVASELTADKGTVVDLGEHYHGVKHQDIFDREFDSYKKALEESMRGPGYAASPVLQENGKFKLEVSLLKDRITGREYSLKHSKKPFTAFGSDKAQIPKPDPKAPVKAEARGAYRPTGERGMALRARLSKRGEDAFVRLPAAYRPKRNTPLGAPHIPDFQPKSAANAEAARKFAFQGGATALPGLGTIGKLAGKLNKTILGDRSRIATKMDEAISTWYYERHGVGRAIASAYGEQIRGEVNAVFKADKNGDLNVTPRDEGASLKISDVIEGLQRDPASYVLTAEQQRVYNNIIRPTIMRMERLITSYGLVQPLDAYFMRGPVKDPKTPKQRPSGGSTVGGLRGFQRERMWKTEKQGWDLGYKYNTDVEARMVYGLEEMYRSIADKRLAMDPLIGGRSRSQLEYDLEVAHPEMSKDDIRKMADSLEREGTVHSKAFAKRIFTHDIAESLNKEFLAEQSSVRKFIADTNSFLKAMKLGYDFGAGQIQLLPTLFNRPDIWTKAQARAFGSFVSEDVWTSYIRRPENEKASQELARYGSSVGRMEEYMSGMGRGGKLVTMLEAAPKGLGKPAAALTKSFARQFQTAMDVAKIELWKAYRDVTPPTEHSQVVKAIEATLLSGRMESEMVPHNRSLIERVALLAPSYYRGAVNFVGLLMESGASGKVARTAMGRFMFGSMALYWGVGLSIGMKPEELKERLNPTRPDFMLWQVDDNGKRLNIGMGGIFRSFLRLGGNMLKTAKEKPGNLAYASSEKNPVVRWYRGHAGPSVGLAWSAAFGKDFLGREKDLGGVMMDILPMAFDEGTKKEMTAQTFGLTTLPGRAPSAEELAKTMFNRDLGTLTRQQRIQVGKKVEAEAYPRSEEESRLAAHRALDYNFERKEEVKAALSKPSREFFKKYEIEVPGYRPSQTVSKVSLALTKEERDELKKIFVEEVEEAVAGLSKLQLDTMDPRQRKNRILSRLESASTQAQGRLKRFQRSRSKTE